MFRMDQFGVFKMWLSLTAPHKREDIIVQKNKLMCVCLHVYVWDVMWCEPLLLCNPTVWDLTAPTAVSMTRWKSCYVCVTQIVERRRKWPEGRREPIAYSHKMNNKCINSSKCLFVSMSACAWKARLPTSFWNAQQATICLMVSAGLTIIKSSKISNLNSSIVFSVINPSALSSDEQLHHGKLLTSFSRHGNQHKYTVRLIYFTRTVVGIFPIFK